MNERDDQFFMHKALIEAQKGWGMTSPNPMVGAVIARDGRIIGCGYHRQAGLPHAEIEAITSVKEKDLLSGSTIYVTLEPCSTAGRTGPCTEAIKEAGISRVVIGSLDPNPAHSGKALKFFTESKIAAVTGVLKEECDELNRAFFKWIVEKKPFVLLKMAMTLDGKIALRDGSSKWISGEVARQRVQELRKWADAIMVGGSTLRHDRPQLTVRPTDGAPWDKELIRFIASRSLTQSEAQGYFPNGDVTVVQLDGQDGWEAFLSDLGGRDITALLLEGGGELAFDALNCNAVDAVEFHIAPKIIGGKESIPVVSGNGVAKLADAFMLEELATEKLGEDLAVKAKVRKRRF